MNAIKKVALLLMLGLPAVALCQPAFQYVLHIEAANGPHRLTVSYQSNGISIQDTIHYKTGKGVYVKALP
ncbi:MAG: hypothetical protein EAY75_07680 [Bacteroidetes bacterium]|nr:MAG: hypothetical protein EAY75_07680 [Bacteroidota bacterium]